MRLVMPAALCRCLDVMFHGDTFDVNDFQYVTGTMGARWAMSRGMLVLKRAGSLSSTSTWTTSCSEQQQQQQQQ
jgi:hypothetical protein